MIIILFSFSSKHKTDIRKTKVVPDDTLFLYTFTPFKNLRDEWNEKKNMGIFVMMYVGRCKVVIYMI